jgi:ABC-type microcin C transport system permease subunit YejB
MLNMSHTRLRFFETGVLFVFFLVAAFFAGAFFFGYANVKQLRNTYWRLTNKILFVILGSFASLALVRKECGLLL